MDEPMCAGDSIRVIDQASAMRGFTGIVLEVDAVVSPEAPNVCNVIRPGRYAPARCLFRRNEIAKRKG